MGGKRILFMGSPAFAVPSLQALHAAGHDIVAVYTQPPRPAGRGKQLQKTAVHDVAERLGIPVLTPERLKGEALDGLLAIACDCICVVAYGLLLPKAIVDTRTCLNVHPSALPRWRGPAPLQHSLMAGDTTTEICIMKLDVGMDTGPVYRRVPLTISSDMTLGELHDTCAQQGAAALCHIVETLETHTPVPQTGDATLAPKITPEMRLLDWTKPATTLYNQVRGLSPAPGATAIVAGETIKVIQSEPLEVLSTALPGAIVSTTHGIDVACGEGGLRILTLQRPGGKAMPATAAARGWKELG